MLERRRREEEEGIALGEEGAGLSQRRREDGAATVGEERQGYIAFG